jgi:hypothetical protein
MAAQSLFESSQARGEARFSEQTDVGSGGKGRDEDLVDTMRVLLAAQYMI